MLNPSRAKMNTVSKLALLAVFGSPVKCTNEADTNQIPVSNESSSPDNYFHSTIEEDYTENKNTLDDIVRQLDAFEKRVLNDHNHQNMLPETDLKLPMLVINSFAKIFRLWQKNLVLKNSIESKKFYDIFSIMFRSLNEESTTDDTLPGENADLSNLTAICDICDEEFELIPNDVKKSYAEHERTAVHIEAINLFNRIGISDKICDDDLKQVITNRLHNENYVNGESTEQLQLTKRPMKDRKIDDMWKQNRYFLKQSDENASVFECYLCDTNDINQSRLMDHCNSKFHKKRELYFLGDFRTNNRKRTQFNDDLIFSRERHFYCVLCQCVEPKPNRNKHITSEYHIGWKNFARKVIELEQPYIYRIDYKSDICFCELCNSKFNMMNSIIPHCLSKNHISLKRFADEIRCLFST